MDQPRAIVPYDLSKPPSKFNLAYIHKICEPNEFRQVEVDDIDDEFVKTYSVIDSLENIISEEDENNLIINRNWKYNALKDYFGQSSKPSVTLTFKEIEKIIDSELPPSHITKRFWYRNGKKLCICHAWATKLLIKI